MAQDWFAAHAPSATPTTQDWFAAHPIPGGDAGLTSGAPTGAPAVEPSALGFLSNVTTSGMQFAADLATPVVHPVETVKGIVAAAQHKTLTAKLIAEAIKKRYGSYDALLATAYADPVGMASDLSIVLGGASAAAKAGGLTKSAAQIGQAATLLNPLAAPAALVEHAGRAIYRGAISPSRRIQRGFPGAIDAGYARNILPTERGLSRTERALEQSAARTDALLQHADRAGAPGVNVRRQVIGALHDPAKTALKRVKLGKADDRGDIALRAKNLARRNPTETPLVPANTLKTEAQTLADTAFRAQERGQIIKDLDALSDLKVAQAYRKAIEVNAASVGIHGVAESNRQTQALIGLAQALEDATQSPSRLTHLMATLGAVGGGIAGGMSGGAGAYALGRIATARPSMAVAGLALGKGSKVARNAQIIRALAVLGASTASEPQE